MKSLIVLAIGAAIAAVAAKYYKINSWNDLKNLVPGLKEFIPEKTKNVVSKSNQFVY
ncbi:MAG: hypothetical protein V4565_01935 [Bacteroidota bacterium]